MEIQTHSLKTATVQNGNVDHLGTDMGLKALKNSKPMFSLQPNRNMKNSEQEKIPLKHCNFKTSRLLLAP